MDKIESEALLYFYREDGERKIVAVLKEGDVFGIQTDNMARRLAENWETDKIYILYQGKEFLLYEK